MAQIANEFDAMKFDVVIIGAGPGGEDSLTPLLAAGLTVAIIESELVGGECFNWACVPSKAMLRAGHALLSAQRLPGAAEAIQGGLDAPAALKHRDAVVLNHDDSSVVEELVAAGATFIRGRGRLDGVGRVVVETAQGAVELEAALGVILATGSTPAIPDVPGMAEVQPWTNREATSATDAPRSLTIIGSGAVALELAQAWRRLGSERVVILSRREHLLPSHETFAGELLLEGLIASGVEVRFGVHVEQVDRAETGRVTVHLGDGSKIESDELLVATGKVPATIGLGLESVGVPPGAYISVADDMTVEGTDWLYAIGDVNGRALFTHQASYHARIAAAAIVARSLGGTSRFVDEVNETAVPQVIFTDPEVATVGTTFDRAMATGLRARKIEVNLGAVLGAQLHAKDYRGRVSFVVDEERDVLIGATFVGQDVADMIHAATVAIVARVPLDRLRHAVPSFPTMSEVWLDLYSST